MTSDIWSNHVWISQYDYFHNYEGEEGEKSGKYEYWGGVLLDRKGQIYGREDQIEKNKKNVVGAGGLCPGIIMIIKYVSQHGVSVTKNIGGNFHLWKFLDTTFIFWSNTIFLQLEIIADLFSGK